MRRLLPLAGLLAALALFPAPAIATQSGSSRADADGNGFPDVGVVVNEHWTSLYAYDYNGDWYWDLGDGRIYGTVGSVSDLDAATLSVCNYTNNSRGMFQNDPYQDTGWISNSITCSGYDGHAHWNYLMVHNDDPRFTGDPARSIELGWGPTWEFKVLTASGSGNFFKPSRIVG